MSLLKKTFLESFRDWKVISLTLTFAPFFVFLMYFYFGDTSLTYKVTVVNRDTGIRGVSGRLDNAGEALTARMRSLTYPEGKPILEIHPAPDLDEARGHLSERNADLVVVIPEDFSAVLNAYGRGGAAKPAEIHTYGDPANVRYIMAAVWSDTVAYEFTMSRAGITAPLQLEVHSVAEKQTATEFDLYIPGLLGLSLMMLMFTAAASIIKEKDKGTLIRLRISSMTTTEWFAAVGVVQMVIGTLALALTYASALILGYRSAGALFDVMVVGWFTCLSVYAISLIVSACLRTVFDLMTIGCFPFFVLMFFSGGMFPLPRLEIFTIGGRAIHINDILPTTHTIRALEKIMNLGAGLADIGFELVSIAVLTLLIFAAGTWLFTRRHMVSR
jgi:ABC-2 type transport system permease protein